MRDDFPQAVVTAVSRRAGILCSNPDCRQHTVGSHEIKDKSTSIGVAAHIKAAAVGGPRYDASQSAEERRSIDNAIWLCSNCATLIDKDPKKFPVDLLYKWKADVDKESAEKLSKKAGAVAKVAPAKLSLADRAAANKVIIEKELARNAYLRTREALEEAKNQVLKIIAKLKETRQVLEHPQGGFYLGHFGRGDEMYGFGHNDKFVCFNWARPREWDIEKCNLIVSLLYRTGDFGFDMKERAVKRKEYRYYRDLEGNDGWVDYDTGENFITTDDLVDQWVDEFLAFIDYK